jgi:tetratricopeptide (TPR) repeat protein
MVYSVIPSQAAGSTPLSSSLPAQPEAHTPPTPKRESEVPLEEPLSPVFAPLELGLAALRRGQYLSARRNLEKAYARTGSRQALMALMLARLASADARGASLLGRIVVSNAGARPVRLQWDPVVLLPSEETFASLVGDLERSAGSSADQHFLAGLLWFTAQQPAAARGAFRRVLALAPDDGQSKAFDAKIQHGITVAYSQENWKALAGLLGQAKTTALQRAVSDRAATQVRIEAAKRELSLLHDRRRRARQRLMVELVALRAELNQGRIEPLAYVKQRDRLSSAWEVEQSKIALEKGAVLAAIEQGQQKLTTLNEVVSTLLTD